MGSNPVLRVMLSPLPADMVASLVPTITDDGDDIFSESDDLSQHHTGMIMTREHINLRFTDIVNVF